MRFTDSLRMTDDSLYSVLSYFNLVIIEVWISGLARFLRVDDFTRRWRCIGICLIRLTPFSCRNFARGRFILVLEGCSLPCGVVKSVASIGVCMWEGAGVARSIDIFFRYAIPLDGQRMLLNASNVKWSICAWLQLLLCRFIRRF